MKSLRCALTVLLLFAGINAAHSLDVTLGVSAWYAWWSSSLEDQFRGEGNDITASDPVNNSKAYNDSYDTDPHLMVGPMLNIKFSDTLSLGFVMLISQSFSMQSSYDVNVPGDTQTTRIGGRFRRYDGDLTVNYRIGYGFGTFCGIKFFRWEGESSLDITSDLGPYSAHVESDLIGMAAGPAVGLSFTRLLSNTLFFTASVSAVIMKSEFEQENVISTTLSATRKEIEKDDETYYAFNGMAGIGYYIESLKSTVILGGRFQYLDNRNDPRDLFYGITATVLYHF